MGFTGKGIGIAIGVALVAALLVLPASTRASESVSLRVLFDLGDGTYSWSPSVLVPDPTALNATWNATRSAAAAAGVRMDWTWYECCGVFVTGLGGQRPSAGTGLFLWNVTAHAWELASVGISSLQAAGNTTIAISNAGFDSVTYAARAPVPSPDDPEPATQFRYDLSNDGVAATGGPIRGEVLWDRDLRLQEIVASPAIGFGSVFVNTLDGFFALDASTGEVDWENLLVRGLSTPALVGGTVLVGGSDGRLHSLNATDGSELWNTSLLSHTVFSGITSSPKVAGDYAYVGTFNETGGPGEVVSVWISNGSVAWRHPTASVDFSSPAVDNGSLYIGLMGLYNPTTQVTWEPPYGLLALDAATGSEEWFFPTNGSVAASPVLTSGLVIVPSKDGAVYALNRTTGAPVWTADVDAGVSSPALFENELIVGGGAFGGPGLVRAVNAMSGSIDWTFLANGPVQSSITVAGGLAYFATNIADGTIYAVNATTGALAWSYTPTPGQFIFSSPVVAGGILYAASDNGHVYAFKVGATPGPPLQGSGTIFVFAASAVVVIAIAASFAWWRLKRRAP